jgi:hypothetical protein
MKASTFDVALATKVSQLGRSARSPPASSRSRTRGAEPRTRTSTTAAGPGEQLFPEIPGAARRSGSASRQQPRRRRCRIAHDAEGSSLPRRRAEAAVGRAWTPETTVRSHEARRDRHGDTRSWPASSRGLAPDRSSEAEWSLADDRSRRSCTPTLVRTSPVRFPLRRQPAPEQTRGSRCDEALDRLAQTAMAAGRGRRMSCAAEAGRCAGSGRRRGRASRPPSPCRSSPLG